MLAFDRLMVQLYGQRLPAESFNLEELKQVFTIIEEQFATSCANNKDPPVTLEFTSSALLVEYRKTNALLTADSRGSRRRNLRKTLTTLLNNPPPQRRQTLIGGKRSWLVELGCSWTSWKRSLEGYAEAQVIKIFSWVWRQTYWEWPANIFGPITLATFFKKWYSWCSIGDLSKDWNEENDWRQVCHYS